jgi:hypothetical protein
VTADDVDGGEVTFTYFAEAPSGAAETGQYTFGPATAEAVDPETFDEAGREQGATESEFGGTDTNYVVGPDTL